MRTLFPKLELNMLEGKWDWINSLKGGDLCMLAFWNASKRNNFPKTISLAAKATGGRHSRSVADETKSTRIADGE